MFLSHVLLLTQEANGHALREPIVRGGAYGPPLHKLMVCGELTLCLLPVQFLAGSMHLKWYLVLDVSNF